MIPFSLSDLRHITDPSTFSRGYDINEAGLSQIKSVTMASDEIMQILSTTQGKKLYKQSINVYAQHDGIKLIGKCSCEVGRNCKHVVSGALRYLDETSEQETVPPRRKENAEEGSQAQAWLERFISSFDKKTGKSTEKSSLLIYELDFTKSLEEIQMSLYTARELKSGGYGKINRARPNTLFNTFRPPEYLKDSDKEVVFLFKALSEGTKTVATLKGRLGALVLEGALKTGRCFWKRGHKNPLTSMQERELLLKWMPEGSDQRLGYDVGEKSFLIGVDPLYYIDTKNKGVGRVQSELDASQLALVAAAPLIPTEQLETTVLELSARLPQLEIEAPDIVEIKLVSDAVVKPVIRLKKNHEAYALELSFEYDGLNVKAFPIQKYQTFVDKKLKVIRQPDKENHFIGRIAEYGFRQEASGLKAESIQAWKSLIDDIDTLRESGFEVIKAEGFDLHFHQIDRVEVKVSQTSHWFEVGMHIMINDQRLPLLPILTKVLNEGVDLTSGEDICIELETGEYASFSTDLLKPIIKTFYELLDKPNSEGFRLRKFEAQSMQNFDSAVFCIEDKTPLSEISRQLKKREHRPVKADGLNAVLRGYQEEGVAWMQFLRTYGFGGILADDMGLGKTLQTLAHLQLEKGAGRLDKPVLIVAPTSLLGNWEAEARKFTPGLRTVQYYGGRRKKILDNINDYDILITTYTLLALDSEVLKKIAFYYLVLDEAQRIKNASTESSKAVKAIRSEHVLALSGTPMENHLGELHSIFDAVMPGFLGTQKSFKTLYQNPIEKEGDQRVQKRLNERIRPFILRRTKDKVAKELPLKTEMIRSVRLNTEQAALYETIRVSMEKSVRESIKALGLAKSHISILAALLKLRQVCCDPRLLKIEEAQKVQESAKLQLLLELVDELRDENRRILIFSQFTTMLEIIEEEMMQRGVTYCKLTGATRKRQEQIERFNRGEADVFLISLKAGGVGLNLTQADTVIHYDPWWNPAAQEQATDRAYRIGQDKPVFVYKLIVEESVEEKIIQMQEDKKALANAIYEGKEEGFAKMDEKDLLALFK